MNRWMHGYAGCLVALLSLAGCAAEQGEVSETDGEVGLLMPASEATVAEVGVVGWELRFSESGLRIAGLAAGEGSAGQMTFTSETMDGVDEPVNVVRSDVGGPSELAYSNGTVYTNTLAGVPEALPWLRAVESDANLAMDSGSETVPYGVWGCIGSAALTVGGCAVTALGAASCLPTAGAGCAAAAYAGTALCYGGAVQTVSACEEYVDDTPLDFSDPNFGA